MVSDGSHHCCDTCNILLPVPVLVVVMHVEVAVSQGREERACL